MSTLFEFGQECIGRGRVALNRALSFRHPQLNSGALIQVPGVRSEDTLAALRRAWPSGRVLIITLDVADRRATLKAMEVIRRRRGGLDIAVLNAGLCEYVDVNEFDSPIFERTMQTNVVSMAYGVEAVLQLLRDSVTPHLVANSGTVSYGRLPRAEAYGASKAAIKNFFEALQVDLVPERISVSIVYPDFVRTLLTDRHDCPRPFFMEADEAARMIVDGIEAQTLDIDFPKDFRIPLRLLTLLPSRQYTRICSRMVESS